MQIKRMFFLKLRNFIFFSFDRDSSLYIYALVNPSNTPMNTPLALPEPRIPVKLHAAGARPQDLRTFLPSLLHPLTPNTTPMNSHPKITKALSKMGEVEFCRLAEEKLASRPRCNVVLGLLGGPSRGRRGYFRHSAGKSYPRYAVRYERGKGIVGIKKHSGPYLCITL